MENSPKQQKDTGKLTDKINIDFDSLLKEFDRSKESLLMSTEEARKKVIELESKLIEIAIRKCDGSFKEFQRFIDNQTIDIFKNIKERIYKEVGESIRAFRERVSEEAKPLIEAGKKSEKGQMTFKIGKIVEKLLKLLSGKIIGISGVYMKELGVIVLDKRIEMDFIKLFYSLAGEGSFIDTKVIHHELIHSKHSKSPESVNKEKKEAIRSVVKDSIWATVMTSIAVISGLPSALIGVGATIGIRTRMMQKLKKQAIEGVLGETQAFIGSKDFGVGSGDRSLSSFVKLQTQIYRMPEKEKDRIIAAYLSVRRLYALGLGDQEIGDLVRDTEWDEKSLHYSLLASKIEEIMLKRSLTEEDLEDLVLASNIRIQNEQLKIKKIAQEELNRLLAEAEVDIQKYQ